MGYAKDANATLFNEFIGINMLGSCGFCIDAKFHEPLRTYKKKNRSMAPFLTRIFGGMVLAEASVRAEFHTPEVVYV
jgi:hypothetical protein